MHRDRAYITFYVATMEARNVKHIMSGFTQVFKTRDFGRPSVPAGRCVLLLMLLKDIVQLSSNDYHNITIASYVIDEHQDEVVRVSLQIVAFSQPQT